MFLIHVWSDSGGLKIIISLVSWPGISCLLILKISYRCLLKKYIIYVYGTQTDVNGKKDIYDSKWDLYKTKFYDFNLNVISLIFYVAKSDDQLTKLDAYEFKSGLNGYKLVIWDLILDIYDYRSDVYGSSSDACSSKIDFIVKNLISIVVHHIQKLQIRYL